jgi:phenylacetate-CoA ligase
MKFYNFSSMNIFLPASDIIFRTEVAKILSLFKKSQWWKPKDLEEFQNKKLRALIDHSYKNVPYYHDLFKAQSLDYRDIRTTRDLGKLPVIDKLDIINNRDKFLTKDVSDNELIRESTSGSSGTPFEYVIDKGTLSASRAIGLRSWGFSGYEIGDKLVTIAGSALLPHKMSFLKKITFKANRNLPLSSFALNDERVAGYADKILDFKPKFIRGHPYSVSRIAKFLLADEKIDLELKAVMTTAEKLYDRERKLISESFNCEVFDQCGCNDGGENLCECGEHSGYHIGVERSIHEFIDESGEQVSSGETGQIILTDLWNYSMPFIRYNAGDLAIPIDDLCPCERGLPLVKAVIGRRTEQLLLSDGSLLPGLTLTDIFEEENIANKIVEYQIVQEKMDKFLINIVKNKEYNGEVSREIARFFESYLGIPLHIEFNFVDNIPMTKAGKRKIVISNVIDQANR